MECKAIKHGFDVTGCTSRFNRDIVECKAVSDACAVFSDSGFNRDIVECKGFSIEQNCRFLFDLIETLWNVKHRGKLSGSK